MKSVILKRLNESRELINVMMKSEHITQIEECVNEILNAIKSSHKILIAGNGGSAADAQHFAAELVGHFEKEREGMAAIALTTDSSIITSIGNDYGYNKVFSRQIEALGKEGDIFIGISTSGSSENIIEAVNKAKSKKMITIGMVGYDGGKMKEICDYIMHVESFRTAKVQEGHEIAIHIICELVENMIEDTN